MLKLAGRMTRRVAALMLVASMAQAQGGAEPVRLAAAGSLTEAMGEVARAYAAVPGNPAVVTTFGPSGLLRVRIERGDLQAEVFFPASFDHALRLQQEGRTTAPAVIFVRNRLCAFARPGIPATTETLLARMLDPAIRLGTSTPGADPSGDYAWALFAKAEALRPGARAVLEAKALQLVGGAGSAAPPPGIGAMAWHLREGRADLFLSYCTGATQVTRQLPGTTLVALPEALAVGADYGLGLLSTRPEAVRLALFALSPPGQTILARHGFEAVTAARP